MKRRMVALFLMLVLTLTLFAGCKKEPATVLDDPANNGPMHAPVTTEPTEPETEPPTEPEPEGEAPRRLVNGGARDYLADGYVDMVKFSEMEYVRPDADAICQKLEHLADMAAAGEDPDAILQAYYDVCDDYLNFQTMDSLAYIRYTLDTNDSYYKSEYDELELESSDIEEKLEAFHKACAFSPCRDALERDYFGYGYFDQYEDYSVFTNPDYLALKKQEDTLLAEYRSALEDPQIKYRGQTRSYNELLEEYTDITTYEQYYEYLDILETYYTQYNRSVGEIYVELIKVRKQMAEVLGYESYADYAYEISYGRDYTHEQGRQFLEGIRTVLVPLSQQASMRVSRPSHFPVAQADLTKGLSAAVRNMGGRVEEAYRFMTAYELFDLTSAPEKFDSSYTTYLYDYEAPFLTVNAQGTSSDYITFSHEFGHFTDGYVSYEGEEDLETAETFSQAMEFLSLCYTEGVFTDAQIEQLLKANLMETLDTFVFQSALADFEDRVYELPEDELTLENLNEIYLACCKDYGVYEEGFDFYYTYRWFEVTHFFEVPYYVISYAVSADTALQVYELEKEEAGAGLAAFERLLDRTPGDGVQAVMTGAGLNNPFREGGLEELAEFFRTELGMN